MSRESARQALASLTEEEADLLNNSPDLLERFKAKHGLNQVEPQKEQIPQWKSNVSEIGQQTLPVVGAVGGAIVGTGLGPFGTAGGGIGGYALGKQGANMLSRSLGAMEQPQSYQQALVGEPLRNVYEGAQAEAFGLAIPWAYKAGKSLVKGAGRQLEQASGIAPKAEGALEAAAEDAGLMFAKGKKAVQSMYQAAKMGQEIRPELLNTTTKQEFVEKATQLLADGTLNPTEALAARKTLDQIKNKMASDSYMNFRKGFDGIAKKLFANSDVAYKDALNAEALRNLFPQNKSGGASPFKAAMALFNLGLTPVISPAIQGAAATGIGLINRYGLKTVVENPNLSLGLSSAIVNKFKNRDR